MEQNSEDALGSRRMPMKCKIHSGEVERARVSSARAPGKRSCFAEYRLEKYHSLLNSTLLQKKLQCLLHVAFCIEVQIFQFRFDFIDFAFRIAESAECQHRFF